MPTRSDTLTPAQIVRILHAALILGQLLFAAVIFFLVRPSRTEVTPLPFAVELGLYAIAVAACLLSLQLRHRIPKRSHEQPADLFWTAALPRAMRAWLPLEAASLLSLVVYFVTLASTALAVAATPVLLLILFNPWFLERG